MRKHLLAAALVMLSASAMAEQTADRLTSVDTGYSKSAASDKILIAWLPGKNRNSHLGACTDEEESEGGCETHTNDTTGASWCTCPKEMGEN
jgi:hypothetical protein